jgi:hypothetical protein
MKKPLNENYAILSLIIAVSCIFLLGCKPVPLPEDQQIELAVKAACYTLDKAGCMNEPALQSVFNGIDYETCEERILSHGYEFGSIDLKKLKEPNCLDVLKGLKVP